MVMKTAIFAKAEETPLGVVLHNLCNVLFLFNSKYFSREPWKQMFVLLFVCTYAI